VTEVGLLLQRAQSDLEIWIPPRALP